MATAILVTFGIAASVQNNKQELTLLKGATSSGLQYKIEPWGTDAVRVRIAAPGNAVTEPIIGALNSSKAPKSRDFQTNPPFVDTLSAVPVVANGAISASLDTATGLVRIKRNTDGKVLLDMTSMVWGPAPKSSRSTASSVTVRFQGLLSGESIFGLGEHKNGRVNQAANGGYSKIFADSLYYGKSQGGDVSIPWYMSSQGYGFVWNLPSLGSVELSTERVQWVSNATEGVDFWVTVAVPSNSPGSVQESMYARLLHNFVDAVGHASPMPYWITGFIQCKDRYRNQSQLLDVARGYVTRGLPISTIVIDWFHWTEMGDMGLNPACWPDPQAMVDELRSMGIELMITFWPFMGMPYNNKTVVSRHWNEFSSNGYLANSTSTDQPESFWRYRTPTGNALIDATNPAAMKAVTHHWFEGYGKYGVKAVWMDEAEPDHAAYISGGQWMFAAGDDTEILPAWVKYWAKGFSDEFRSLYGDDYFILSRNAWAGTWSTGAALWSGDIGSHYGDLQTAVTAGQSASLSGIPLWTTDIGGYSGGDPADPQFQRLIVRWFQFGAFSPLFRLHGHRAGGPPPDSCGPTNGDNEVWNLAKDPEHYEAIRAVMMLREDLRDYIKRLNDESVALGMPMMRPMAFAFPGDEVCANNSAENQFMLGDSWLISPVTADGATSWDAYLPALPQTEKWVYWWNQTIVESGSDGKWISVNVSAISDFPLFFRRPISVTMPITE